MHRPHSTYHHSKSGFTLLEVLIVLAIMLILMAGIFAQVNKLQQVYKTEETKVDSTAESRNLLDEITRELHQAGYPGDNLFNPNALAVPAVNDARVAVGLVRVSPSELWFEGDIDNDGVVDVVDYKLMDSNGNPVAGGSTCPCTLERSQLRKQDAAPLAQPAPVYVSGLSNVLNSAGVGAAGASLALTGSSHGIASDVAYAAYKTPSVFTALDQNGNPVAMPVDLNNAVALARVKSIIVTVNTLTLSADPSTQMRIPSTVTVTAKINN